MTLSPSPDVTIRQFFTDVYQPQRMIDKGACSVEQYHVALNRLDAFLEREALLSDLSEETLTAWMAAMSAKGLAQATINGRVKSILTFWRYAKRKKFRTDDASPDDITLLREPRRQPRAWLPEEMERIIESARLARGRFCGVEARCWWPALVLVLYDTGLRLSAGFAIRFEEIDFQTKMLCVPAERMKNSCEQYFRLSDQTLQAIIDTLPPRRALLFPWPFTCHRALYGRLRVILRRAGMPHTKRDMFHKFRRTTASNLAKLAGASLAIQQLGHRNESTISRYVDPRFTSRHDGALLLPRPMWDGKTIEVQAVEPEQPVQPPLIVSVPSDQLRGTGDDLFARLKAQPVLTGADLREALEQLKIPQKDFAQEVGTSVYWLSKVCCEREPMSYKLELRIRSALGLEHGHRGEAMNRDKRA